MRHHIAGRKLNRDSQHRQALINNLVKQLVVNGRVVTTLAKAKAIQPLAEKLMTKAKNGDLSNRRLIHQVLQNTHLVNKLVDDLAKVTKDRTSGFTRIIKLGVRKGDDALKARIEWTDQKVVEPKVEEVAVQAEEVAAVAKKPATKAKTKKPAKKIKE